MGKSKAANSARNVPNKALHSRVSYLYQAATYLAAQQRHSSAAKSDSDETEDAKGNGNAIVVEKPSANSEFTLQPVSRRLISDLREVALKVQIRVSPTLKQSICKNCDTLLVDGSTCSNVVENKSKGVKKPWADMLVRRCNVCGFQRRFPLAAKRQKRRPHRTQTMELDESAAKIDPE
jgi:ribonuclease P protein subunit RPR2